MGTFKGGSQRADRNEIEKMGPDKTGMKQSGLMPSHKAVRSGNAEIQPDREGYTKHPNLRDADKDGM